METNYKRYKITFKDKVDCLGDLISETLIVAESLDKALKICKTSYRFAQIDKILEESIELFKNHKTYKVNVSSDFEEDILLDESSFQEGSDNLDDQEERELWG